MALVDDGANTGRRHGCYAGSASPAVLVVAATVASSIGVQHELPRREGAQGG